MITQALNLLISWYKPLFYDFLNRRQNRIGVALEVHIWPHPFNAPVGSDQNGAPQNTHELFAIPFTFAPEAPLLQYDVTNVGQQGKIQTLLFSKGMMRGDIIGADAIDGNV